MTATTRARLSVLAAATLFATGGAAIKAAQFNGFQVASLRSGVAALALFALMPEARRLGSARAGLLVIAFFYAATVLMFVLATKLTTAASAIFLQSSAPLYVLLLSPFVLKERVVRGDLVFLGLVMAGMTLFFVDTPVSTSSAPNPRLGNWLGAATGLTYAVMLVGFRWLGARGGSSITAAALGNLLACLLALPAALPLGQHPPSDYGVILYLGLFQIALAYWLLTRGISRVAAFEASLLLFAEPALSPVFAWLMHGEIPSAGALTGGALILLGALIKSWRDAERSNSSAQAVSPGN